MKESIAVRAARLRDQLEQLEVTEDNADEWGDALATCNELLLNLYDVDEAEYTLVALTRRWLEPRTKAVPARSHLRLVQDD